MYEIIYSRKKCNDQMNHTNMLEVTMFCHVRAHIDPRQNVHCWITVDWCEMQSLTAGLYKLSTGSSICKQEVNILLRQHLHLCGCAYCRFNKSPINWHVTFRSELLFPFYLSVSWSKFRKFYSIVIYDNIQWWNLEDTTGKCMLMCNLN